MRTALPRDRRGPPPASKSAESRGQTLRPRLLTKDPGGVVEEDVVADRGSAVAQQFEGGTFVADKGILFDGVLVLDPAAHARHDVAVEEVVFHGGCGRAGGVDAATLIVKDEIPRDRWRGVVIPYTMPCGARNPAPFNHHIVVVPTDHNATVVAVTDDDPELAQRLCDELGEQMWGLREDFLKPLTPIEEAVQAAMDAPHGPIILADVADNPGGGAPGDGTEILRELLKRGAENVGVACIKDPEAVAKSIEAGVKGTLDIEIGGKTDGYHGKPLKVRGTVRTITDGRFIHKAMAVGVPADVGRTVVIDVQGVEIILTERSHAPNDPEVYRRNGVEPTDKKILVLKSRGHFRAAYEPFSEAVIEVDAPGLTTPNLDWFTYRNIPRPMWPFDEI